MGVQSNLKRGISAELGLPKAGEPTASEFARDVVAGLSSSPKHLPCKYFYDARGSALFEQICETPEYYVTRTELALLEQMGPAVADSLGPRVDVLEPGAGVGEKVRIFLRALHQPRSFVPIDISQAALEACVRDAEQEFPELVVEPICADFTQAFELPQSIIASRRGKRVVFFPGSTISNFADAAAVGFIRALRGVLDPGDFMLIGVDRVKDKRVIERAYNDEAGITAAFNLNLIERMVRELHTDNLRSEDFRHVAFYNEAQQRIEMHLESTKRQRIEVEGMVFELQRGERIHTENSYKYSPEQVRSLLECADFALREQLSDKNQWFSLYWAEAV